MLSNSIKSFTHLLLLQATCYAESFDWRNVGGKDFTTPVKNQDTTGTCYAFSTIATFESRFEVATNNPDLNLDLSEQYLISSRCCGSITGGWDVDALEYFVSNGVTDEKTLPFAYWNQPQAIPKSTPLYKTTAVDLNLGNGYLDGGYTTQEVKSAIKTYGPLDAGIHIPGDWYRGEISGTLFGTVADPKAKQQLHTVSVVGYLDDPGVWIIKNSWGSNWGDHGYGYVPYGVLESRIWVHAIIGDVVFPTVPEPNYFMCLILLPYLRMLRK